MMTFVNSLMNPFQKSKCPYCNEQFYPGNCAIVSSRTGTMLRTVRKDFFARAFVPPMNGPYYTGQLAHRQCLHCGNLLPRNVERVKSHTIAIVGDTFSGKSHYIATCINQLKQIQAWQVIGCSKVVGQGKTDAEYNTNYYDPVYIRHEQIDITRPATSPIIQPLIYEMVFHEKSALKPARSINLLFYDSSGEDIVQQNRMVLYSHYILDASVIIFLADPLSMPSLVNVLPSNLRPKGVRKQKPSEVLNRVIQTFEQNKRLKPGAKLKTPIAITISKSDLLKFVTKYGPPPLFLSDTTFAKGLDTREFTIINNEVEQLLQRVGDQELLPSSASFSNKNFFAVSPTGWPSDGAGKFPSIEPLRCLDPLLWAFWKIGIISNE